MFSTEPNSFQKGHGLFHVDRYPVQRGRGFGGIFANLLRKVIPFGKSFLRTAANSSKKILQSDLGKDILSDSLSSAATAAATALIENNPKEAREVMLKSLKRSRDKSKGVIKRIAKDKLEEVLTGSGKKRVKYSRSAKNIDRKYQNTLLDM